MIYYKIGEFKKIAECDLKKMDLADSLKTEIDFSIYIDGKMFFSEPLFPILEFVKYCLTWNINTKKNFIYNSIESDVNPILSFYLVNGKWKIYSVWQKFECNQNFSQKEITSFIKDIININNK